MLAYEGAMEKFGAIKVKFLSYYKYSFSFTDGNGLVIGVGGNTDDIYKLSVRAGVEYTVKELEPNYIDYNGQNVYDGRY